MNMQGGIKKLAEKPEQIEVDPVGTLAMLAGICGIAVFWLPWLNLLFPMTALTLGAVSLRKTGRNAFLGNLPAIGGVILGGVLLLLGLFVIDVAGSLSEVLSSMPSGPQARASSG